MASKSIYIIAFLMSSTSVLAQPPRQPKPEDLMVELDSNHDNKLSRQEVKGKLKNDFDKIDSNSDGFLTIDELRHGMPKRAPKPKE